jgi:Protein kinase domain
MALARVPYERLDEASMVADEATRRPAEGNGQRVDGEEPPGLEEVLRRNLRGELHRQQLGVGAVIDGKWELRRPLGTGGFGRVWEAWHLKLDHPVAIKILDARHGGDDVRQRFLDEARLMAGMASEHLVRATDYGELPDGSPYFIMQLVEGKTLRHWLRERLPMWRAVEIAEEILEGLTEVHRRGVVHGDVKPENIVIGEDGKARLLDFGLAQVLLGGPSTSPSTDEIGGTPPYMAPEMLLDGSRASARSDVYAMGVVLYEMLTGRLPRGHVDMGFEKIVGAWERKPKADSLRMHCKDVQEARAGTLEALDELVMAALSREPGARLASAQRMLDELRRLQPRLSPEALAPTLTPRGGVAGATTKPGTTSPIRAAGRRERAVPHVAAIGVIGALGAAAIAWWWALREPGAEPTQGVHSEHEPVGADLRSAREGILVAGRYDPANDAAARVDAALCEALGGDRPVVRTPPVSCRRIPAATHEDDLVSLAETERVRVVVLVGDDEVEVRSTSHHRGNPLVAKLRGLPLPTEPSDARDVALVLKAVVGTAGLPQAEIPALDPLRVGARWAVLAAWLRAERGLATDPDRVGREALRSLLRRDEGEGVGFYRDLAELVWASSTGCTAAAPAFAELGAKGEHDEAIRVAALLGLAACLMEGDDAASRADEAQALLGDAFAASADNPCVRVAAIGTMSRIDRWKGTDALWDAHARSLPVDECEPRSWSQVLAVRGDALVDARRWCDAASAYARAYGMSRASVVPLLAWAEYDWKCNPSRMAAREGLLDELRTTQGAARLGATERVSSAYMRWWLTRDPAHAEAVTSEHAAVKQDEVPLLEGVASDLEQEICAGADDATCSWRILTRPKRAGDELALRRSLGLL